MKKLTLNIIHKDGKVLLGKKKKGFGSGFWNGFGGKVEPGEDFETAAMRELSEEAGILPKKYDHMAILKLFYTDQSMEVHVYKTHDYDGEPVETDEMAPQWFDEDKIPFDNMWPDDIHWMPYFLKNAKIKAEFKFDKDYRITSHNIEEHESL